MVEDDIGDRIIKKAKEEAEKGQQESQDRQEVDSGNRLAITLYRNGFMLSDDQVFRPYEDPKNKKFLEELHEGDVPREIRGKYPKGIDVGLIDKKEEDYKEPPKPVQMFGGQGL